MHCIKEILWRCFQDKENGVEVVNEVGGGDSSEKKDTSEKSDEKWKKNYVPYQEPEEDSNKQPQGE